jgi:hypothetical protein
VCRYVGITSTFRRDYHAVEAVLEREKPDFVQIDYSIDNREVEKTILPLAAEIKAGVLTALPYGNGRLFRAVHGKELPDWARAFANSWGQFFLKYLLGDPRVTAVIPGTSNSAHMADNAGAMQGPLPDPDQRRRMISTPRHTFDSGRKLSGDRQSSSREFQASAFLAFRRLAAIGHLPSNAGTWPSQAPRWPRRFCLRIKMGEDFRDVETCGVDYEGGPAALLDPRTPNALRCFFLSATR